MTINHWVAIAVAVLILIFVAVRNAKSALLKTSRYSDLANVIQAAALTFNVPASRIAAIIAVESALNPNATGSIGERGLMQLTRGAVTDVNAVFKTRYTFDEMYDPDANVAVGAAYLSILLKQTGTLNDATRAYNVGFGNWTKNHNAGLEYLTRVLEAEKETSQLF